MPSRPQTIAALNAIPASRHARLPISSLSPRFGREPIAGNGNGKADDHDVIWGSFTSPPPAVMFFPGRLGRDTSMRLLVVEDEARIRAFLARAFEIEGFKVDVV